MRTLFRTLMCLMLVTVVAGCGIVYKPDIHQGNLLDKEKVQQLKPGMTKRQVVALLGTPSITSPFEHQRWDYVQERAHRSGKTTVKTLTLYFNNDTLSRTQGNFFAETPDQLLKDAKTYKSAYPKGGPKGDKTRDGSEGDNAPSGGGAG